jgi:carboxyl-terminal processing protease
LVLKISAFQSQTAGQIQQAISDYKKTNHLRGVLFDLRDNPGGLLSSAVEIADMFLSNGMIVSTKGRGEPEQRYQALAPAMYPDLKLAFLLNHYSASAAEVLAGAMQDRQRAIILGENSYGKGSVQKLWPIAGGRAIKLTVARYYTPSGRLIEGKGIQPDIKIVDDPSSDSFDSALDESIKVFQSKLAPNKLVAKTAEKTLH